MAMIRPSVWLRNTSMPIEEDRELSYVIPGGASMLARGLRRRFTAPAVSTRHVRSTVRANLRIVCECTLCNVI